MKNGCKVWAKANAANMKKIKRKINMRKVLDTKHNIVKIELSCDEDKELNYVVSLAKYFVMTKSIKAACDCTEQFYKLFVKGD